MFVRMSDYVSKYNGRAKAVDIGGLRIFFSYETPIGFITQSGERMVNDRYYSNATSRHQAQLDPKHQTRVPEATFCELLELEIKRAVCEE